MTIGFLVLGVVGAHFLFIRWQRPTVYRLEFSTRRSSAETESPVVRQYAFEFQVRRTDVAPPSPRPSVEGANDRTRIVDAALQDGDCNTEHHTCFLRCDHASCPQEAKLNPLLVGLLGALQERLVDGRQRHASDATDQ